MRSRRCCASTATAPVRGRRAEAHGTGGHSPRQGVAGRRDLKADGKLDRRVKLGTDFLGQVVAQRRPVLAHEDGARERHHAHDMELGAAFIAWAISQPQLGLGLRESPE